MFSLMLPLPDRASNVEHTDNKRLLSVHVAVSESQSAFVLLSSTPEASFKPAALLKYGRQHHPSTHHSLLTDTARWWELSHNLLRSRAMQRTFVVKSHNMDMGQRWDAIQHVSFTEMYAHFWEESSSCVSLHRLKQMHWWLFRGTLLVGALLGCRIAPAHPWCLCLKTPGAETHATMLASCILYFESRNGLYCTCLELSDSYTIHAFLILYLISSLFT